MSTPIIAMLSWPNVVMVDIDKIVFHTEFLQNVIYLRTFTIQIVSSQNYAWYYYFILIGRTIFRNVYNILRNSFRVLARS